MARFINDLQCQLQLKLKMALQHSVYIFPIRNNIRTMTRTTPIIPVGPYPQELLYPHVGKAPTKTRIKTISKMVPNDIFFLLKVFNIIFS